MATSTQMISGLASGFDWKSTVDQLMGVQRQRITLIENQKKEYEQKLEIFRGINTKLLTFLSSSKTLSDADAFNVFKASTTTDSATYKASDLLSISTNTDASIGAHTITMNANSSLAQARKLSSKSFSTYDTALGLSGEVVINGRAVAIDTGDDLGAIAEKINNLDSGINATGVTASILTASSDNYRLVLTSENTGKDAFTIFDASAGSANLLSSGLGFTSGSTTVKNLVSNGAQSEEFSSSILSVQTMLGLGTAQTGSVTIGSFSVSLDLSKSLTDLASAINTAASGASSNVSASVATSTDDDGVTKYQLKIANTTSFTDANNVLQSLGILSGSQSSVAEVHISDTANTKVSGGNIASSTYWTDINTTGGPGNNITDGDTITITGTNHIGTAISATYTIDTNTANGGLGEQVSNLLTAIQNAYSAVNGGSYGVTASIENGKIKITDLTSGDSQATLSLTANNQGGGTLNLGTVSASTEGYSMELKAGLDANVIIDGTAITSSTNVIDNAIAGVTVNLLKIESGTTVELNVARDNAKIKSSVDSMVSAYNAVMSDIFDQFKYDEKTKKAGILQGDGTLSSVKSQLVSTLTQMVGGLPSTLNALSLIGFSSDNSGKLSLNSDKFMTELADDFSGVRRLFVAEGSATDGDVQYVSHAKETIAGEYPVNITAASTQASASGTANLAAGIGSGIETLTIKDGNNIASIVLEASGNGSSITNIVNAINSELSIAKAQSLMGNVKLTTNASQTTAITSSTTWSAVYSGGVAAGLANGDEITFSGHKKNGSAVSGSYLISDTGVDTVQGLLSAIESAYGNEASAAINSYGYLTITDSTTGNSAFDISITEPSGKNLDFGSVTTSNLVGTARNTKGTGASAITSTDLFGDIDGHGAGGGTIYFGGYTANGEAVKGSYVVNLADPLSTFLSAIETAYGGTVDASLADGRIVLSNGTANSTLGLEIFEPSSSNINFGTMAGGQTGRYSMSVSASDSGADDHLNLTHNYYGTESGFTIQVSGNSLGLTDNQTYAGTDVAGTINGEPATGIGQVLIGDAPADGDTTSIEGLEIKYTGSATGDQGTVKITMGVAELFERALNEITNTADGYLGYRIESTTDSISAFDRSVDDMQERLNIKMQTMINRFIVMEGALSKLKNQSSWLSAQINQL